MATLTAQELLMNALRARQEGRAAEALRQFAAVIAAEPNQPVARNVLGMDALERGDAATAAEHFSHALRSDRQAPPLWINLATARRLQGDDEGERAALEGALSVDRTHLMALIRLAQLHERLGETTQAGARWGDVTAAS